MCLTLSDLFLLDIFSRTVAFLDMGFGNFFHDKIAQTGGNQLTTQGNEFCHLLCDHFRCNIVQRFFDGSSRDHQTRKFYAAFTQLIPVHLTGFWIIDTDLIRRQSEAGIDLGNQLRQDADVNDDIHKRHWNNGGTRRIVGTFFGEFQALGTNLFQI